MQITSPIFTDLNTIPNKYGFEGKNISPMLTISEVPAKTLSLAIIMHDPDSVKGDFLHWILWNIPAETNVVTSNSIPEGAILGVNDMKKTSYVRPTPPKGSGIHRYLFELYALDNLLDLPFDAKRTVIETTIKAHTIEKATLTGLYSRQ